MFDTMRRLFHRISSNAARRQRFLTSVAPRCFERLEARAMLAADTFGAIAGVAFNDLSANGLTADDGFVAQATVNLYQDVNLNGQLDGTDVSLASTTTSSSDGSYRFDGLGAGRYLVEQLAVTGLLQRPGSNVQSVTISAADALGQIGTPIDSFVTSQSVAASSRSASSRDASSSVMAPEAIGGERDVQVELTSQFGEVELNVNPFGQPVLEFATSSNAIGRRLVTWDGQDGDADTLAATGLGHHDLTSDGAVSGFVLTIGADHPDGFATIRVYSDAANWSQRQVPIPEQVGSVTVHFSEFTVGGGTGARFDDLGAVQLEVTVGEAVDGQIDVITTVGPTVFKANFANYEPVSVGNQVWSDSNNDGIYDAASESVIADVKLNLYVDTDANQQLTPGTDQPLGSTITGADGRYIFGNLFPGSYIVQVAQSNFDPGGVLEDFVTSSGNTPTLDPDQGDVDGDDNGDALTGHGVVAAAVTLTAHGEPRHDGDDDANTNLTVDFGFEELIPDVSITKTDHLTTIVPGQQLTYEIVVTSIGNTTAENVIAEDTLPIALVSLIGTNDDANVSFNASSGVLIWSAGDIAEGASRTLMVTVAAVNPIPAATETVTNTVTASHEDPDPTPENNTDTDVDEVLASPDYTITKDDGRTVVEPGDTITYDIVVSNVGNQDGTGVVVTDQFPVDAISVISTVPLTTVDPLTGTIVWNLGDLAAGDARSISLEARVHPDVDESILEFTNNVRVTDDLTNGPDPTPANNVASDTDQVDHPADVSITKTDYLSTVTAGQQLTYDITVDNIGVSAADNVLVTDTLPLDLLTFHSTSDDLNVVFDAGTGNLVWSAGDIAKGGSKTLQVTATIANPVPAGRETVVNPVTVKHDDVDPTPENNSARDVDVLEAAPDYQITKDDGRTLVLAGDRLIYEMQVSNVGTQDGTGVKVTDAFPTNVLTGIDAGLNGVINASAGSVVWNLGDLAVGETRTITFEANVNPDIAESILEFTNTVSVTDDLTNGPDPTPANNVASDTDQVDHPADVSITKTDHLTTVMAGQQLTYDITVDNIGNSVAENVIVTDILPVDLVALNATSDDANVLFDAGSGQLVWSAGDIPRGGSTMLQVTVTVADAIPAGRDTIINPVTVTHDDVDPTPENNSARDVDVLVATPDYQITKDDGRTNVVAGDVITYVMDVSNVGDQDGTGVTVADTFPTRALVGLDAGPEGNIDPATGTVVWNLGDLAVGETRTVTFTARVNPGIDSAIEQFTNETRVADDGANGPDPTPSNNVATDTDVVDLVLSRVSGFVYADLNDNGVMEANDIPLEGVSVRMTGRDVRGNAVDRLVQTAGNGQYVFEGVAPGLYDLIETQPEAYNDGKDTAGTVRSNSGGLIPQSDFATLQVLDDYFSRLPVGPNVDAQDFNFGELAAMRSKRDHLGWSF